MWIDYSKIADWQTVKEIVVGGLKWIGFSKVDTRKRRHRFPELRILYLRF